MNFEDNENINDNDNEKDNENINDNDDINDNENMKDNENINDNNEELTEVRHDNGIQMDRMKQSNKVKLITLSAVLFGALIYAIIGLYILLAPRWTQVGYVNVDFQRMDTYYQYPKTEPYLMDYLMPAIVTIVILSIVSFIWFIKRMHIAQLDKLQQIKAGSVRKVRKKAEIFIKILFFGWVVILFGIGSVAIGFGASDLKFLYFDSGPYLTWAKGQDPSNSITVCWHSSIPTQSKVYYGTDRNNLNKVVTALPPFSDDSIESKWLTLSRFHQVPITGLSPNTTYYYRVYSAPGQGISTDPDLKKAHANLIKVKQFTTAPIGSFNYSVFLWSDPRTNDPYSSAINQAVITANMSDHMTESGIDPAFSICTGDISARGVDYQTWKLWLDDLSYNDFASNRSNVVAIGNHERHDDTGRRNYPNYYPVSRTYNNGTPSFKDTSYSFVYGNTQFIILDRWDYDHPWWKAGDMEYAKWLEQEILSQPDVKFRILAMHPNPVIGDAHSGNCTNIMNVAKQYKIDAIFCGHWHTYSTRDFNGDGIFSHEDYMKVDNLTMMIGLGGNSANPSYAAYCQIDVSSNMLKIRARWIDGEYFNGFRIEK